MKSILDPKFRYTPAANTDLRRTFARIQREQQREQKLERERDRDSLAQPHPVIKQLNRGGRA